MTVNAQPRYKALGAVLLLALLCCYLMVAVPLRQPLHALFVVLPVFLYFASILVPTFLDQNGVEYRMEDDGVRLVRFGRTRRVIRYETIRSVRNQRGTLILGMKGFWSGSQLLHPDSHVEEFMRELEMKIAKQAVTPNGP